MLHFLYLDELTLGFHGLICSAEETNFHKRALEFLFPKEMAAGVEEEETRGEINSEHKPFLC